MKLYPINTGYFKLDGGAMFGVVPKSIWQRTNPADNNNMCDWAMRSLLIEDGDRLMLIDTGMGTKQSDKFFGYYYMFGNDSLDGSLAKYGFTRDDAFENLPEFGLGNKKGGDLFSGRGPSLESKVKSAFTRHFNSTGKVSAGQLATMSKQADRDKLLIKQKKKRGGGSSAGGKKKKAKKGGKKQ